MVLVPSLAAKFLKPLISASLDHSFMSIAYRPFSVSRLLRQIDMETVDTSKRLARLRSLMKENKVDIYSMCKKIILRGKPSDILAQSSHLKTAINPNTLHPAMLEEVRFEAPFYGLGTHRGIEYICGFSGSAGTAVVTLEKASLATDGRYFNQASKQLDSNWTLLKQGMEDVPTWQDWYAIRYF
jgi:Xaa-Pro aminopeptidase